MEICHVTWDMKCGNLPGAIFDLTDPRDKTGSDITTIIGLFAKENKILPRTDFESARWECKNSALLFVSKARTRQQTLNEQTKVQGMCEPVDWCLLPVFYPFISCNMLIFR
jgi:hypothetical protein